MYWIYNNLIWGKKGKKNPYHCRTGVKDLCGQLSLC